MIDRRVDQLVLTPRGLAACSDSAKRAALIELTVALATFRVLEYVGRWIGLTALVEGNGDPSLPGG